MNSRRAPKQTSIGKRVGGFLYIHVDALRHLPQQERAVLAAALGKAKDVSWNVAKIGKKAVTLLLYEQFDLAPFPVLQEAVRIPLTGNIERTSYRRRSNPPILHRKELLLSPDDSRRAQFAALTRDAEAMGLFHEVYRLGTKVRWTSRLAELGVTVHNHRLVPLRRHGETNIARHKTAIARQDMSQPIQIMVRKGIIKQGTTVLDYGCGHGKDLTALHECGVEAWGWDPHYAPDGSLDVADVVNLGFVINVIDDPEERQHTLWRAWSLCRRTLTISAMLLGRAPLAGLRPHNDGFLTSRGTFQKYYAQDELRTYIKGIIGEAPVALAPGIFAVFRDKNEEQEFLLNSRLSHVSLGPGIQSNSPPSRVRVKSHVVDRIRPHLESILEIAQRRGRLPEADELQMEAREALKSARVSHSRALSLCLSEFGAERIEAAAAVRRDDLRVHLALTLVPGMPNYRTLPSSIQRDVRALFGTYAQAMVQAQELLFSAGQHETVRCAAEAAQSAGIGIILAGERFRFSPGRIASLPAVLRCVLGCAEILQGGLDNADVVEIRLDRPLIVAITCDDFRKPLPLITERIRIDLARLKVEIQRSDRKDRRILLPKAPLMPEETRAKQEQIETKLAALGLIERNGFDPLEGSLQRIATAIRDAFVIKTTEP